jgi:hypothetical protein
VTVEGCSLSGAGSEGHSLTFPGAMDCRYLDPTTRKRQEFGFAPVAAVSQQ